MAREGARAEENLCEIASLGATNFVLITDRSVGGRDTMADKKRISVEEMLAAARKADGDAAAPPDNVKPAEHES